MPLQAGCIQGPRLILGATEQAKTLTQKTVGVDLFSCTLFSI